MNVAHRWGLAESDVSSHEETLGLVLGERRRLCKVCRRYGVTQLWRKSCHSALFTATKQQVNLRQYSRRIYHWMSLTPHTNGLLFTKAAGRWSHAAPRDFTMMTKCSLEFVWYNRLLLESVGVCNLRCFHSPLGQDLPALEPPEGRQIACQSPAHKQENS